MNLKDYLSRIIIPQFELIDDFFNSSPRLIGKIKISFYEGFSGVFGIPTMDYLSTSQLVILKIIIQNPGLDLSQIFSLVKKYGLSVNLGGLYYHYGVRDFFVKRAKAVIEIYEEGQNISNGFPKFQINESKLKEIKVISVEPVYPENESEFRRYFPKV